MSCVSLLHALWLLYGDGERARDGKREGGETRAIEGSGDAAGWARGVLAACVCVRVLTLCTRATA